MKTLLRIAFLGLILMTYSAKPCFATTPLPKGSVEQSIVTADGLTRIYQVFRPAGVPADKPLPVVISLHGYHQEGDYINYYFKWDALAATQNFVTVYPSGIDESWNAGGCCGEARAMKIDDVGFLTQLAQTIVAGGPASAQGAIDPNRVYLSGFSNGAMMSYRMVCQSSFRFAAVAVVASSLQTECASPTPTPIVEIHGLSDSVFPFDGKPSAGIPPTLTTYDFFVKANDCGLIRTAQRGPVLYRVSTCPGNRVEELLAITGLTHRWTKASDPVDATSFFWNFLSHFNL